MYGPMYDPGMPNPDLDTLRNALNGPDGINDPMKRSEIESVIKQHDPVERALENLRMHGPAMYGPGMHNPDLDTLRNALNGPMSMIDPAKRSEIENILKQHDQQNSQNHSMP
jgi:hypothetical protein